VLDHAAGLAASSDQLRAPHFFFFFRGSKNSRVGVAGFAFAFAVFGLRISRLLRF
jgi:hypothetical protein